MTTGSAYKFKVQAQNVIGDGAYSLEKEILAARVPDAPASLTQVSTSSTEVTFSWTAPDDGGSSVTKYVILQHDGSAFVFNAFINVPNVQFTLNYGLTAGDTYQFKV